jgi:hypothetical protein
MESEAIPSSSEIWDKERFQHMLAEPPLRIINLSDKLEVVFVSTALRRLWLLDPDSFPEKVDQTNETELEGIFNSYFKNIGITIANAPLEEKWDDRIWRSRTDFAFLDPPLITHEEGSDAEAAAGSHFSVWSPWRQKIYKMYNHVFWDVYQEVKSQEDQVGEFEPPNVLVWEVKAPLEGEKTSQAHIVLQNDTFLYPVWLNPGSRLSLAVCGREYTWSSDGSTWTEALWCKGGERVTVSLEPARGNGDVQVGAVLVVGNCKPRNTFRLHKRSYPPREGEFRLPGETDDSQPAFYPEADHLARAIFLKAGDAVDRCIFDETYAQFEGQKLPEEDKQLDNTTPGLYRPLPNSRSTRLLVVEPGALEDDLQTHLIVVNLDDSPVYEAISYTWGAPTDKVPLKCRSGTVLIPSNLEQALRRIRYPDRRRHIWADAACINQEDITERGQQVSIMRHIFQAAERVLTWLGSDQTALASKAFTAVCCIVRSWRLAIGENKFRFVNYHAAFEPLSPGEADQLRRVLNKDDWAALQAMFDTELFRRFWIIQELALARAAVVIWGDHHIEWGLVGVCAAWMLTKGWMFSYESKESASASGSHVHAAVYNAFLMYVLPLASRSTISNFAKLDLSAVLGTTMAVFQCTDERDRIYALLSMQFSGNDPNIAMLLRPDYEKGVRTVYVEAARCMLRQDEHLRLLSAVQHSPGDIDSDYPSWVPRWDRPQTVEPLALREEQGYYSNGGELFFPDGETFGPDGESLFVNGLQCGTVIRASETVDASHLGLASLANERDREALRLIFSQLCDEQRQLRSSWSSQIEQSTLAGFNNPEAQDKAIRNGMRAAATTAVPGRYGMRQSTEIITGEKAQMDHLGELLLYWRERSTWKARGLQHERLEETGFWQGLGEGVQPLHMELVLCSMNALLGRRIFHCDDGRFGLGPASLQDGDVVAVLFGGIVPFVLRPLSDDRWQFVGECFIPGLMQGETVEAAGLLQPGTYERTQDQYGTLRLHPAGLDGSDPRFHRKVGEHGMRRFEIR